MTRDEIVELMTVAAYQAQVAEYDKWWRSKFGDDKDDEPYATWDKVHPHIKDELRARVKAQITALEQAGLEVVEKNPAARAYYEREGRPYPPKPLEGQG